MRYIAKKMAQTIGDALSRDSRNTVNHLIVTHWSYRLFYISIVLDIRRRWAWGDYITMLCCRKIYGL